MAQGLVTQLVTRQGWRSSVIILSVCHLWWWWWCVLLTDDRNLDSPARRSSPAVLSLTVRVHTSTRLIVLWFLVSCRQQCTRRCCLWKAVTSTGKFYCCLIFLIFKKNLNLALYISMVKVTLYPGSVPVDTVSQSLMVSERILTEVTASRDVWNTFFLFLFSFWKNSDLVWNGFDSVWFEKNVIHLQGSYRPWKVMEFNCWDFQAWKVLEKGIGPWKPWKVLEFQSSGSGNFNF